MEISYRLFQWDDIDEIVSIICDTWQLDKMCKDYQKLIIDYKQNCFSLYKNSAIKFANEIVLFAVDRRYQRKGIGTELFKLAGSIFEKEAHSSYYLYTDTSCNYRYYDHLGMKKMGSLKPRKQDNFEIYLYGKN